MRLIKENRTVCEELVELANRYGAAISSDTSYEVVNSILYKRWRKEKLEERYTIADSPPQGKDLSLLSKLGFIADVDLPTKAKDDSAHEGVLVLGDLRESFLLKLKFLSKFSKEIYNIPSTFHLLGTTRALDKYREDGEMLCTPTRFPFKENWQKPSCMPQTETEMMAMAWEQSVLPNEWTAMMVKPISHNIEYNIREWFLKNKPVRGSYIILSRQPNIRFHSFLIEKIYKGLIRRNQVDYPFSFIPCGPTANYVNITLSTFLDVIRKQFFEETFRQKLKDAEQKILA